MASWPTLAEEKFTTMASYVELGGLRTWYDELGTGDPLVLLHPGLVDSRAFGPNLDALAARFRTFTPERRGHGRTPDVDGPITFELMADDTIRFLEQVVGAKTRLVGCSDGAIVALLVALRRPELVSHLVSSPASSITTAGCLKRLTRTTSRRSSSLPAMPKCHPTARTTSQWSLRNSHACTWSHGLLVEKAEGPRLFPKLVVPVLSSLNQAIWLMPTADFANASRERRNKLAWGFESSDPERFRENFLGRERLLADYIESEVARLGLPFIEVNGERTAEEIADAVVGNGCRAVHPRIRERWIDS